MRNLGLDFQPQRPRLLPVVLLCGASLLCLDSWSELLDREARLDDLKTQLVRAQRQAERYRHLERNTSETWVASPEKHAKTLEQVISAAGIDWEALFTRIEQATQSDIVLLAITPNVSGKSLQISGEARNITAALSFVTALNQTPLSQANLLSHKIRSDDPLNPIVFEITATWSTSN